jgi:hypothetical protein
MLDALSIVVYVCETMHFSRDEPTKPDAAPKAPVSNWQPGLMPSSNKNNSSKIWMKASVNGDIFRPFAVEVKKPIEVLDKNQISVGQRLRAKVAASVGCLLKHVSIAKYNKKQDCWTITKSQTRKYAGLIRDNRLLIVKTEDLFLLDKKTAAIRPSVNEEIHETMRVYRGRTEIKLSMNLDISDVAVD